MANLTSGGSPEHIATIVNEGALKPLVDMLDTTDKYVGLRIMGAAEMQQK